MLPVITVLTAPTHTALTSLAAVKAELMDTNTAFADHDALLTRYIREASDAIVHLTRRSWARARYREFLQAEGCTLWLRHTPIVTVETLAFVDRTGMSSDAITDFDNLQGEGLRLWSTALVGHRSTSNEQGYQVEYAAGYFVPDDDYTSDTLSFDALTNTISDTASGIPLLGVGDTVVISGAGEDGNNGTATVVSRTDATLEVSGLTLADEMAGADVTLAVRTLPEDVEWACIELVKSIYLARQQRLVRPAILEEPGGAQRQDDAIGDIPRIVWRLLKNYREVYV